MTADIFKYLMTAAYVLLVYGLAAASLVLFGVLVRRYIPLWVVADTRSCSLQFFPRVSKGLRLPLTHTGISN